MKRFLCIVLVFSLLLYTAVSFADNKIRINDANFPDEGFRKHVETFDENGDHCLDDKELMSVETIDCSDSSVSSLEGIRYFQNLKLLDCSYNKLTMLDLRENYSLEEINCRSNEINVLLLPQGSALRSVECQENNMKYMSVNDSYSVMRPLIVETERQNTEDGFAQYSKVIDDGSTVSLVLDPEVVLTAYFEDFEEEYIESEYIHDTDGDLHYQVFFTRNNDGTAVFEQLGGQYRYSDRTSYSIPNEIEGLPVTAIGDRAFADFHTLAEITIPDTVTKIGDNAFAGCWALSEPILPAGLESIGNNAFLGCNALLSLTVPDSVISLLGNPFVGWENGADRIKLGKNSVFEIRDDALIHRETQTMVAYLGREGVSEYTIPDGIKSVGEMAFSECGLKSVIIPESVIEIGDRCFEYCLELENISLPDSLEKIGDGAFYNCTRLKTIRFPDNLKTIGSNPFVRAGTREVVISPANSSLYFINDTLFSVDDSRLISYIGDFEEGASEEKKERDKITYTVPDGIRIIGDDAFSWRSKVSGIILPDNTEVIGASAFEQMKNLKSINIPASVREIGSNAFHCSALSTVEFNAKVKTLPDYLFSNCVYLTDIVLPDTLETIGKFAFFCCESLQEIYIPDSVREIGGHAFRQCTSLRTIHLPDNLQYLPDALLLQCSALQELEIPSGVTDIGMFAISECNGLKELRIPGGVKIIRTHSLSRNESLERVVLNEGTEIIETYAFGRDTNLKELVIPASVQRINIEAFSGCERLHNEFTEYLEELRQYVDY